MAHGSTHLYPESFQRDNREKFGAIWKLPELSLNLRHVGNARNKSSLIKKRLLAPESARRKKKLQSLPTSLNLKKRTRHAQSCRRSFCS